ncbi:sensor histidine kinase [Candidatus Protochlamydia phocaeensis]|uniref:sensor histidine kinase n=1 Tax=Candidatus Protochlamydia phocaeensis TaxID=1414722 RepID=UPI0008390BC8|nr:ATP-binding protein [Candidatus Protochlamydia phocaeensis]
MLSFRQKIFVSYAAVFFVFIILLFPFVSQWVHRIIVKGMENRASEIIANIKEAPNNEALVRRLKDQKSLIFFRISVISNERKVLYDSHVKRLLGPKFSQDYIINHPEVMEAFQHGVGYKEDYSNLLHQKFSYLAKAFDFHGKTYVLRTAFPHQYMNEITNDFEIGFLGFATAILLMFSLMTWFAIHHLTKPIQKIITAVKPYQAGSQHILPAIDVTSLNPHDDFTKLALTLNSLSARIQNHIDTITHERNEKQAILESLVEGVIAVDVHMVIAYANYMAVKLIGHLQGELVGEPFKILNQTKCYDLLQKCQEENKPLTDTLDLYLEGKRIYLDIVAAPKKNNGGAILVLQDKTAHYKIFEMRRDFIANASHELKTPITVIKGFAEALHDNPGLPRDVQEQITTKIVRSCNRMTALIKDLLTLADIENIPSSRLSECDLFDLSERCRSMVLEAFPDAIIQINKHQEEVNLIADADLLELAIMNLMENAAKYSNRPAKITVNLDDEGDHIKIEVADQGIGIPFVDQEHIFDRFYTVDKAHSQKMGGSGLGLSIVKTIVEKHFGTISLASEIGKGSTFTIKLPKRKLD